LHDISWKYLYLLLALKVMLLIRMSVKKNCTGDNIAWIYQPYPLFWITIFNCSLMVKG
jgi:hypothetical protein